MLGIARLHNLVLTGRLPPIRAPSRKARGKRLPPSPAQTTLRQKSSHIDVASAAAPLGRHKSSRAPSRAVLRQRALNDNADRRISTVSADATRRQDRHASRRRAHISQPPWAGHLGRASAFEAPWLPGDTPGVDGRQHGDDGAVCAGPNPVRSRWESRHATAFASDTRSARRLRGKAVPGSAARVLKLQSSLSPRYRAGLPGA